MGASLLALAKSIYYNDTECYVRCDWRCPWSIRVQIHGDVTRSLFSLFCSTWRAVLKMFVRFRIKASEILEKSSTGAIYKTEKWRNGDKMSSWLLKNAWTTRNLHNSCRSCFIAVTDSPFCRMFSPLFCFEQEKTMTLKKFSKKLYTIKLKKQRRSRDEK